MARTDHHGPRQIPTRTALYRARPGVRTRHQRAAHKQDRQGARLALRQGTEPPRTQRRRVDWDVT
ncbi:hypothetical protein [Streptomyces xiamenensis]|uniref:hypothetical protein n=1 Tax=Streptomyces xiamenensis TaxID=408015 RepID=UPI003D74FB3F